MVDVCFMFTGISTSGIAARLGGAAFSGQNSRERYKVEHSTLYGNIPPSRLRVLQRKCQKRCFAARERQEEW